MTDEQFQSFQLWFTNHIGTFRETDPMHQRSLDLKKEHTARVIAVMNRLTRTLRLSKNACRVASVTALFHDLGRFPQYRRYRTFRDPDSENHAKLSIRELTRYRVLHSLEPEERHLIGRAIIFHNRLCLPDRLDPVTLLHSRLIRDADKVDILRVMADEFRRPKSQQNPVVTLGLNAEEGVRDEVYRRLFAKRIMNYTELKNANEFKVLQMSWLFDINFRETFEILRERDDLDVIAATLPATAIRDEARSFIKDYIDLSLERGIE